MQQLDLSVTNYMMFEFKLFIDPIILFYAYYFSKFDDYNNNYE